MSIERDSSNIFFTTRAVTTRNLVCAFIHRDEMRSDTVRRENPDLKRSKALSKRSKSDDASHRNAPHVYSWGMHLSRVYRVASRRGVTSPYLPITKPFLRSASRQWATCHGYTVIDSHRGKNLAMRHATSVNEYTRMHKDTLLHDI